MYTYTELGWLMRQAGLEACAEWGGFDGADLTIDSPRMIVLARVKEDNPGDDEPQQIGLSY